MTTKINNRLLVEPASVRGFAGDSKRKTGMYNKVHEDLSIESTQKSPAEVGLCKKSNIIFDIGNVIVRWKPFEVIKQVFPKTDPKEFFKLMYPVWKDLNLGKLSIKEALSLYTGELQISEELIAKLLEQLQQHQTVIPGTIELLKDLKNQGYQLYSITDNIKEFVEYHRKNSNFFHYFKDVIISAEVGILKPDPKIFQHLLDKHQLNPAECIFIDDLDKNIEGAKSVGIEGIIFTDPKSCREELLAKGIKL